MRGPSWPTEEDVKKNDIPPIFIRVRKKTPEPEKVRRRRELGRGGKGRA